MNAVTYIKLRKALCGNTERAQRQGLDALAAAASLHTVERQVYERAARALLQQSRNEELWPRISRFEQLPLEGRFALVALHAGQWSYERLGAVLEMNRDELEASLWKWRLQLLDQIPASAMSTRASCPEYENARPWTQRWLDEEISSSQEKFFLQNHLMACDGCRGALNRCRDFYYSIEKAFPDLTPASSELEVLERFMARPNPNLKPKSRFLKRPEIMIAIVIMVLAVLKILHG